MATSKEKASQKSEDPNDALNLLFDEFVRISIVTKLIAALNNLGITPEPEFLERIYGANLDELSNVVTSFPAYITAAMLEKETKKQKKDERVLYGNYNRKNNKV